MSESISQNKKHHYLKQRLNVLCDFLLDWMAGMWCITIILSASVLTLYGCYSLAYYFWAKGDYFGGTFIAILLVAALASLPLTIAMRRSKRREEKTG